jgi:hypothetical protein
VLEVDLVKDSLEVVDIEFAQKGSPDSPADIQLVSQKSGVSAPSDITAQYGSDLDSASGLLAGNVVDTLRAGVETSARKLILTSGYAVQMKATTGTTTINGKITVAVVDIYNRVVPKKDNIQLDTA